MHSCERDWFVTDGTLAVIGHASVTVRTLSHSFLWCDLWWLQCSGWSCCNAATIDKAQAILRLCFIHRILCSFFDDYDAGLYSTMAEKFDGSVADLTWTTSRYFCQRRQTQYVSRKTRLPLPKLLWILFSRVMLETSSHWSDSIRNTTCWIPMHKFSKPKWQVLSSVNSTDEPAFLDTLDSDFTRQCYPERYWLAVGLHLASWNSNCGM